MSLKTFQPSVHLKNIQYFLLKLVLAFPAIRKSRCVFKTFTSRLTLCLEWGSEMVISHSRVQYSNVDLIWYVEALGEQM